MATGGLDLVNQLCKDLLSCDICCEGFNYDTHAPRVLPCFHSFCAKCLGQLTVDGSCQCPKCRNVTQVSGKFPMDTTRIALLDKKRALHSQEGVSCEGCTEGAKATSRCRDCEEFLCEDCCTVHRKLKTFKNHSLLSLTEARENPDKLLQSTEKCERHSDKKLELFCISCSTAVCAICAFTMHKKCEDFVELDTVLDEKKNEMLSLCDQLDKVELRFQAKAEESEASLKAVRSNLSEAVDKVDCMIDEIISSVKERQAEITEELRAMAKFDELLLEEQAANFRSLQSAAHSAAQYGRTCVSLSLASQVFTHSPELQKTIENLSEKTSDAVKAAPNYEVSTERLADLKELLKDMGRVDSTSVSGGKILKGLPVALPSLQLDTSRCGPGCWVGADSRSLSNQPRPHSHPQPQAQRFKFGGTCTTVALPGTSCYWQVRCVAHPKPQFEYEADLCEIGVATQQALQSCPADRWISETKHCALIVVISSGKGHVDAVTWYRDHLVSHTALAPCNPLSPVDQTVGLLLDTAASRLHIIDVNATRVLCSSDIDLSTPVWPVSRVWPEKENGAGVEVEVQSGEQIGVSGELASLLCSVL